jgi:hypothetical protein
VAVAAAAESSGGGTATISNWCGPGRAVAARARSSRKTKPPPTVAGTLSVKRPIFICPLPECPAPLVSRMPPEGETALKAKPGNKKGGAWAPPFRIPSRKRLTGRPRGPRPAPGHDPRLNSLKGCFAAVRQFAHIVLHALPAIGAGFVGAELRHIILAGGKTAGASAATGGLRQSQAG